MLSPPAPSVPITATPQASNGFDAYPPRVYLVLELRGGGAALRKIIRALKISEDAKNAMRRLGNSKRKDSKTQNKFSMWQHGTHASGGEFCYIWETGGGWWEYSVSVVPLGEAGLGGLQTWDED
jgi:hypothetical protein